MDIEARSENIYLVQKQAQTHAHELLGVFTERKICACDFAITGSQDGHLLVSQAAEYAGLLIIDHHIPIPQMRRAISSTVIANAYVGEHGSLGVEWAIAINHTDADSILSALVMSGHLPAHSRLDQAAIAADHTGEENLLSDVLQALEDDRDLEKSIAIAQKLFAGEDVLGEMPAVRKKAHEKRYVVRHTLHALVDQGAFHWQGKIAWIVLDDKIDAALAPALLPEAKVIVIASPMPPGSNKHWRIRSRLGIGVEGVDLSQMGMPDSGGRWNAISTSRHGGTNLAPQAYVSLLEEKLNATAACSG